jgi:L,D-transpeptidase catalytic domain
MRLHCRTAAIAAAVLMVAGASARADLLIQIDKNTQQMTVSADGKPLYTWPVSTGRQKYNTPNGEFKPLGMERHHYSREWDYAPMPYSIFFTEDGHAIHGTNEQRALGRAVSHGCVRLSVKHAAMLWDLVKKEGKANTKVVLSGDIPAPVVAHAKPKRHEHQVREARHRRERHHEHYTYAARAKHRYSYERRYYRYYDRYAEPSPFPYVFLPPIR